MQQQSMLQNVHPSERPRLLAEQSSFRRSLPLDNKSAHIHRSYTVRVLSLFPSLLHGRHPLFLPSILDVLVYTAHRTHVKSRTKRIS